MRQTSILAPLALLLALPSCSAPVATCGLIPVADLPVTYTSGHRPVVTVTIAGKPVHMLVDSGTADSFLTPRAYDRLNLVGTRDFDIASSGVSGDMQDHKVIMENIMLGQTKLDNDVLILSNFGDVGNADHPGVDGLIGEDVLEPFDVGWDLPDNRITLFAKPTCPPTQTPWPGDYAEVPFTFDETRAPMLPYAVDGQTIPAILDSGAATTLLQQPDLAQAGVKPQAMASDRGLAGIGINGRPAHVIEEQFSSVSIGAETYSDPWIMVGDSHASLEIPSLVGEDFLSRHRVFIANSSQTAFIGLTVQGH
jgi:predicted aspartyl protease